MNRLEVLLDALKEADRHVESLLRVNGSFAHGRAMSARDDVVRAIIEEKEVARGDNLLKAQNDLIAAECERLEAENQNLRDELNVFSGYCNGLRAEVQELLAKDAGLRATLQDMHKRNNELRAQVVLKPGHPALENVLAKLRCIANHWMQEDGGTLPDSFEITDAGASLDLGDLRRWVESEAIKPAHCVPCLSKRECQSLPHSNNCVALRRVPGKKVCPEKCEHWVVDVAHPLTCLNGDDCCLRVEAKPCTK